jgi:hypothetical protein
MRAMSRLSPSHNRTNTPLTTGCAALLYREPRAAYVTATVDTSCFVVSQNMFNLLLGTETTTTVRQMIVHNNPPG